MPPKYHTGALKAEEEKRRTVFKPVLENPYTKIVWPEVSESDGHSMVELLVSLLAPIGEYQSYVNKKVNPLPDPPTIANSLTLGFNPTNAAVEDQIQLAQKGTKIEGVKAIFVCRSDVSTSLVVSHFPVLCAAGSITCGKSIKLIQLPKGSLGQLSNATGRTDPFVIGLRELTDGPGGALFGLVEKIAPVNVPWIHEVAQFQLPAVRNVKTTAPIKVKQNQKQQAKEQNQKAKEETQKQHAKLQSQKAREEKAKPTSSGQNRKRQQNQTRKDPNAKGHKVTK
ncbi:hypothetical protein TRVA0_009S00650 [Trichomonascus vanleenenianus]|uniref:Pop3p n=1 Tax=Trichomonascus vanleenenianus TaxID=2268995 RepID=UPI003ECACDF2